MSRQNNLLKIFSFCCLLFAFIGVVNAQPTISIPLAKKACPTIGNASVFSVQATVSNFDTGGVFVLQLSNKQGRFNSGGILELERIEITNPITTQTLNFEFMYPLNDGTGTMLGSDDYTVRVIEENSGRRSLFSKAFSAFIYDGSTYILEPRSICELGKELRAENDLDRYLWYRIVDGFLDELVQDDSKRTYIPTQPGRYYYLPFFGECTPSFEQFKSTIAVVDDDKTSINVNLVVDGPTSFCASDFPAPLELRSSITGTQYAYRWLKDDIVIAGENLSSLKVGGINAEGTYAVEVIDTSIGFAECRSSLSNEVFVDLLNPSAKITSELNLIEIPGQAYNLEAEITGQNPIITWTRNGVDIPNSNSTIIQVSESGNYQVRVTANSPCGTDTVVSNEIVSVAKLNSAEVFIDYKDAFYNPCVFEEVILEISRITVETNTNEIFDLGKNLYDKLNFTWKRNNELLPKDNLPDGITIEGSEIAISNANLNGEFSLDLISGDNTFTSNSRSVVLALSSFKIESSDSNNSIPIGGNVVLTVNVPTIFLTGITYQWLRNGVEIQNATEQTIQINTPGNYSVRISSSECLPGISEEFIITAVEANIPNFITPNFTNNNTWKLPAEFISDTIELSIVDPNGKEVFNGTNYQNNWPLDTSDLEETIYYYIISRGSDELKKGTITILR